MEKLWVSIVVETRVKLENKDKVFKNIKLHNWSLIANHEFAS